VTNVVDVFGLSILIKNGQSRMNNQEWTIKNEQSRMNNQEWTIQRHRQHWSQDTEQINIREKRDCPFLIVHA
jgi:hypothetical protein